MLLASQNEKISQFDNQLKSGAFGLDNAPTTSRTTGTQITNSGMSSGSNTLEKTAKKIGELFTRHSFIH
jgi:hypothetical protein